MRKTDAVHTPPENTNYPFNHDMTFESFVVGEANQLAYHAAQMFADAPMPFFNPLLICSGFGQGKTHLMQAIGNKITSGNPQVRIHYTTSESFSNGYIQALQKNSVQDFRRTHQNVEVILIEDIQHFKGRSRLQNELFHTLYDLLERRIRVAITLNPAPSEMPEFEPILQSLLHQGLTVEIEPPDINLTKDILHRKAEQLRLLGVNINPDQIYSIARDLQGESDVRKLIGRLSHTAFQSWLAEQSGKPVHSTS